jgi:hypothetical protein
MFHFNVLQQSLTVPALSSSSADFAFRDERPAHKWTFSREL